MHGILHKLRLIFALHHCRCQSMASHLQDTAGREPLSVALLAEKTESQALDERRLALIVNSAGLVVSVSDSPEGLFDFEPQSLVGSPLAYVIDVLRPTADPAVINPVAIMQDEDKAAKMLVAMAHK